MRLSSSHWHESGHEPPPSDGPERSLMVLLDVLPPLGWLEAGVGSDSRGWQSNVMAGGQPLMDKMKGSPPICIPVQSCPINKEKTLSC